MTELSEGIIILSAVTHCYLFTSLTEKRRFISRHYSVYLRSKVAIAAAPGLRTSAMSLGGGQRVSSFEHLCARLVVQGSTCTVTFFAELSSLLDELVTRSEPVIMAGDFNIRLDRPDDHHSRHLLDVFSDHGLQCRVSSPTHDRGGILDVVATRADLTVPEVSVLDVGISDHRLLRWTSQLDDHHPSIIRRRIVRGVAST